MSEWRGRRLSPWVNTGVDGRSAASAILRVRMMTSAGRTSFVASHARSPSSCNTISSRLRPGWGGDGASCNIRTAAPAAAHAAGEVVDGSPRRPRATPGRAASASTGGLRSDRVLDSNLRAVRAQSHRGHPARPSCAATSCRRARPRAESALRGRMRQPLTQQAQKRARRARRRGERVALSIHPPRTMCMLSLRCARSYLARDSVTGHARAAGFHRPRGASRCAGAARQRALHARSGEEPASPAAAPASNVGISRPANSVRPRPRCNRGRQHRARPVSTSQRQNHETERVHYPHNERAPRAVRQSAQVKRQDRLAQSGRGSRCDAAAWQPCPATRRGAWCGRGTISAVDDHRDRYDQSQSRQQRIEGMRHGRSRIRL